MKKIKTAADLKEQIRILEEQHEILEDRLKGRLEAGYEGVKPLNIVKKVLPIVTSIPFLKSNLLNTALGLGVSFLVKKIIDRRSKKRHQVDEAEAAKSNGQKKHGWFKKSA